jgi:hypothetical protein
MRGAISGNQWQLTRLTCSDAMNSSHDEGSNQWQSVAIDETHLQRRDELGPCRRRRAVRARDPRTHARHELVVPPSSVVLVAEGVRAAHLWGKRAGAPWWALACKAGGGGRPSCSPEAHSCSSLGPWPKSTPCPRARGPGWGPAWRQACWRRRRPRGGSSPPDEGGNQHAIGDAIRGHPEARSSKREEPASACGHT